MKKVKSISLISPQLLDLSHEIVAYVPPEFIDQWVKSDRSETTARAFLASTTIKGTLVCSDTAGLSKLSQKVDIIEAMSYVSKPKEIIYSHGKVLGGIGIGLWAADNTEMFYDESVPADQILAMLLKVQEQIAKSCKVKVGFGVHFGTFYKIGNGVYGPEADFIEDIAEDYTEGGEVVISSSFAKQIKNKKSIVAHARPDISTRKERFVSVTGFSQVSLPKPKDINYPIPFSRDFYKDIRKFYTTSTQDYLSILRQKYIRNKVVVLIERARSTSQKLESELLNDLALYAAMSKISVRLLNDFEGKRIKTVGNLGIYIFSDAEEAYQFAVTFKHALKKEYSLLCRTGIAKGEVLVFLLEDGTKEIAGNPVNIASKLAQDRGEFGKMYLSQDVYEAVKPKNFTENEFIVSGVTIKGYIG